MAGLMVAMPHSTKNPPRVVAWGMGSWSTTIMGSDDALDAQAQLYSMASIHDDSPTKQKKEALEGITSRQWMTYLDGKQDAEFLRIKLMATACMFMECGAHLPAPLALQAIHAARTEDIQALGWRDKEGRKQQLALLVETIENYRETPTILPQEDLVDAWAKRSGKMNPS
jgi:hypothetical protein